MNLRPENFCSKVDHDDSGSNTKPTAIFWHPSPLDFTLDLRLVEWMINHATSIWEHLKINLSNWSVYDSAIQSGDHSSWSEAHYHTSTAILLLPVLKI